MSRFVFLLASVAFIVALAFQSEFLSIIGWALLTGGILNLTYKIKR